MTTWAPIWVMPNLRLEKPIEAGWAALVPYGDARIVSLSRKHKRFGSYMRRFTDAFGVRILPSVLLTKISKSKKSRVRVEAMASFRDVIVAAVVPYGRALALVYENKDRAMYSNTFWLHPWMIDKNYEWLLTSSIANLGLHQVKSFKGQSTPEIFARDVRPDDIDDVLLFELLQRWRRRYYRPKPAWSDQALFRSLNMASVASQLPSIVDMTLFDVGRILSLWVSAFEILVHPGVGKSSLASVYATFDNVKFYDRNLSKKIYRAFDPVLKKKVPSTLPRYVYGELYNRRNAFLHGNPVSRSSLRIGKTNLLQLAPSLYRLALTSFLDLRFNEVAPSPDDSKAFVAHYSKASHFHGYQHIHERALLRARG